ncbi:MAG: TadE/TadG family type IV pilus assembly protein [Terriglobales bacterium]
MFRLGKFEFSTPVCLRAQRGTEWLRKTEGSAILEFAITIPLLVVFVVGIYDFSGAFNQKQKIEQAAQEGAIVAGAQPMTDISAAGSSDPSAGPDSLQPVVIAIFNSLAGSGVLPNANQGTCTVRPPPSETQAILTYQYIISGCSSYPTDDLVITINRGCVCGTPCAPACGTGPVTVGTNVTVTFPYHWRFNSVIQLLIPGASYQATTTLTESATVHNQM